MIDNLTEAIKHCHEKAEEIRKANEEMPTDCKLSENLCECAAEHEQLAEWLTELGDIRKIVKDWQDGKIDDDMPMLKAFSRIIKIIEKSEAENETDN